jgi:XTP/dITP diphosphohydrolase
MKSPLINSPQSAIRNPQSAIEESTIPTLLIATSNKGKVAEIASLLEGLDCRAIGLEDLPQVPPPVEETGTTFVENALIKADYYQRVSGLLTLADDSGLEVDALDGRPGVYSARYGGEGLSSAKQIGLLLEEMKDTPEERRTARFVCVVALVGVAGKTSDERESVWRLDGSSVDSPVRTQIRQTFEARCEGRIAFAQRGAGGFGYDPIFIDAELGRTFAELSPEEKSSRSHRGKALRSTIEYLESILKR